MLLFPWNLMWSYLSSDQLKSPPDKKSPGLAGHAWPNSTNEIILDAIFLSQLSVCKKIQDILFQRC